jgi:hypothetical protein
MTMPGQVRDGFDQAMDDWISGICSVLRTWMQMLQKLLGCDVP